MNACATRRVRGVAIPETALVVGLFLMILYGVVEYAIIGYEQVSADGATFIGAHDTVARFGGPTSANNSYTQTVVRALFSGLRQATVTSVPNNGSYETDISYPSPPGGLAGLLPSSLDTVSRTIEPSRSVANPNTPVGTCATGAIALANGQTAAVTGGAVNLLQGAVGSTGGLFSLGQASGQTVVNLSGSSVLTRVALLQNVQTQLQATTLLLSALSALNVGGLLTPVSATLRPLLDQALTGTLTQGAVTAASSSLSGVLGLLGALIPGLTGALNPLLGGPGGGALMTLSNSVAAVTALDAAAPTVCP